MGENGGHEVIWKFKYIRHAFVKKQRVSIYVNKGMSFLGVQVQFVPCLQPVAAAYDMTARKDNQELWPLLSFVFPVQFWLPFFPPVVSLQR